MTHDGTLFLEDSLIFVLSLFEKVVYKV